MRNLCVCSASLTAQRMVTNVGALFPPRELSQSQRVCDAELQWFLFSVSSTTVLSGSGCTVHSWRCDAAMLRKTKSSPTFFPRSSFPRALNLQMPSYCDCKTNRHIWWHGARTYAHKVIRRNFCIHQRVLQRTLHSLPEKAEECWKKPDEINFRQNRLDAWAGTSTRLCHFDVSGKRVFAAIVRAR